MNKLKFNEEKENNGVVRKRITDSINRRKLSFVGILTGIMLIMIISFTTTAKVFGGPAGGAEVQKPTEEPICTTMTTTIPVTTARTSLQTTVTTTEETTTTETTTSLTATTAVETTESTTTETTVIIVEVSTETEPEAEATIEDNTVEEVVEEEYNDEPESTPEYIVYKPSTHYIHRSTCHWFDSECYEIQSTEGLECRRCTECNPDMEIITPYVEEPTQQPVVTGGAALDYITEEEYIYLCNTVGHEYGSDWVPIYDKASVVATVMNRVRDGGWSNGLPSTIYNVLTAPYQYNPNYATPYYHSCVTQSCKDAVDYYFAHQNEFPNWHSFWGDGRYNHFS